MSWILSSCVWKEVVLPPHACVPCGCLVPEEAPEFHEHWEANLKALSEQPVLFIAEILSSPI